MEASLEDVLAFLNANMPTLRDTVSLEDYHQGSISVEEQCITKTLNAARGDHEYLVQKAVSDADPTLAPAVTSYGYQKLKMRRLRGWNALLVYNFLLEKGEMNMINGLVLAIMERVHQLYTTGYAHLDLNLGNIFVNDEDKCITFIDFEISRKCEPHNADLLDFAQHFYMLLAIFYKTNTVPKPLLEFLKQFHGSLCVEYQPIRIEKELIEFYATDAPTDIICSALPHYTIEDILKILSTKKQQTHF
jgi:tRNA A-37 threonylcarbamoyl transferase component Bud32